MKYTPGEWRISGISQDDGSISIAKDQIVICYVTNAASFFDVVSKRTPEAQFANARLVAAAPELLDALVLAERFMSGFEGDPMQVEIEGSLRQMRTAIAKATGTQS